MKAAASGAVDALVETFAIGRISRSNRAATPSKTMATSIITRIASRIETMTNSETNAMAASKVRDWVHILGFTITLSLALILILDLEYPRIGWIRIDAWDRVLLALRA